MSAQARVAKVATALATTGLAFIVLTLHYKRSSPIFVSLLASQTSSARALQTPTETCDDWPATAKLQSSTGALNVESWTCLGGGKTEVMPRSRADARSHASLSPAQCKEWCLLTHPPEYNKTEAELAEAGGQRWCCEWRATQDGGQCAWSDGVPNFTHTTCSTLGEKSSLGLGCASPSLAFEPCLGTVRYRRFGGGRCLHHDDVLIGRFRVATRLNCARRCAQQAEEAQPGEMQCKVFGISKMNATRGRRLGDLEARADMKQCVLLEHCKVRPRESRTFNYYATPEGIPDVPALTT